MFEPLVSILINNYNYGRFLRAAIDSALRQNYRSTEIIVVDDGSSDGSREIISSYGGRIIPIFKENGGQGSAFNAGVAASRGDVLCFLDADDFLFPKKVGRIVDEFRHHGMNSKPIMVHHLLALKNEAGDDLDGPLRGKTHKSPMNLYAFAERHRFLWYQTGPTTSLSINRLLADRLFPIPEDGVRVCADDFVVYGASLIGEVYSLKDVLAGYRVHGNNAWYLSFPRKSPEFMGVLQDYLNTKLVENNLVPVISFGDSMHAWSGLVDDRKWLKLGGHMIGILVKDHDKYTAIYACRTLISIGKIEIKKVMKQALAISKGVQTLIRKHTY